MTCGRSLLATGRRTSIHPTSTPSLLRGRSLHGTTCRHRHVVRRGMPCSQDAMVPQATGPCSTEPSGCCSVERRRGPLCRQACLPGFGRTATPPCRWGRSRIIRVGVGAPIGTILGNRRCRIPGTDTCCRPEPGSIHAAGCTGSPTVKFGGTPRRWMSFSRSTEMTRPIPTVAAWTRRCGSSTSWRRMASGLSFWLWGCSGRTCRLGLRLAT